MMVTSNVGGLFLGQRSFLVLESAALKTILASLSLDSERILRNRWRLSGNYLPMDCLSSTPVLLCLWSRWIQ